MFSPKRATAVAILALFSALVLVLSQGGFFKPCNPDWYFDKNLIVVTCHKDDGTLIISKEDMNLCIVNNNGILAAQDYGGLYGSCSSCSQESYAGQPSSLATCGCHARDGLTIRSILDLDTFVTNKNGLINCFGHLSSPI